MVVLISNYKWNLRQWHDWLLEDLDLRIGRDYRWAWHDNCWAIEFLDAKMEIFVQLKMSGNDS